MRFAYCDETDREADISSSRRLCPLSIALIGFDPLSS